MSATITAEPKNKILAKATRTFSSTRLAREYGRKNAVKITVTAEAYQLGGNRHPHFSVTADIYSPRWPESPFACGCLHEEALKFWPKIKTIIDLHLSNADDGEPMHAVANGFYQLAGAVEGHFGERYHSGNSERHFPITPAPETPWKNTEYRYPTKEEALVSCVEYLRAPLADIQLVRQQCQEAFTQGAASVATSPEVSSAAEEARTKAGNAAAKARFALFIDTLRPRWKAEAEAGLELLRELAFKKPVEKALCS